MASSELTKEMECSFCLHTDTDPVKLSCGHNFCQRCVDFTLIVDEGSGETRERYSADDQEDIALCELLGTPRTMSDQSSYSQCTHTPGPAMISCLLCEVHSKSPEYIVSDNIPLSTSSLKDRKDPVYKIRDCYPMQDSNYMSLSLKDEQQGHQTLDQAPETRATWINVQHILMTRREETQKRVQDLQERRRTLHGKAEGEAQRVTALFRHFRRSLEDLEKKVLSDISGQVEQITRSMSTMIKALEKKKDELSRKINNIEELCTMMDPWTVLLDSGDCEDGDNDDGGDLDVARISSTILTGLSDMISGTDIENYRDTKDNITSVLSSLQLQPTSTILLSPPQVRAPNTGKEQPTSEFLDVPGITLDLRTAGYYLDISDDGKTISRSNNNQSRPVRPERFHCSQVLSDQSFSSLRHCWEVDVGGSELCSVGMCYPSIDRRGDQSGIGYNMKSWGLERCYNKYIMIHNSEKIRLSRNISGNRVRIDLDYEAGQISFYELCDPIRHLHTFTSTFTEPLHAVLGVGAGFIKISGGN